MKVNIAFFATPSETKALVANWIRRYGLACVAMMERPRFVLSEIESAEELANLPAERVALQRRRATIGANSMYEFSLSNPDAVVIDIGGEDEEGLSESALSVSSSEDEELYKSLAADLRKSTRAGLRAINPMTGASSFVKNVRYSSGAAAVSRAGRKLKPVAGWNYYEVEK